MYRNEGRAEAIELSSFGSVFLCNLYKYEGRVYILTQILREVQQNNKAYLHVKTLFIQGRNPVPSRSAIGYTGFVYYKVCTLDE